jgi:hypothetical protein
MSLRADLIEAYKKDLQRRFTESAHVKEGSIVEDEGGTRFTVITSSEKFDDVKKYDTEGSAVAYMEDLKNAGRSTSNIAWVVVKDDNGTKVFPYGDDGVTLVTEAASYKAQSSIAEQRAVLEAYKKVTKASKPEIKKPEKEKMKKVKIIKYTVKGKKPTKKIKK